ncbi:hypothetical protein GYMLUDRAFT_37063 [Collybiopsis luxurians FD-317 M1]|nr:hypothetical protein GYMLUDRAFT_37063 [Collybiopsis luxurians FD-317 M1]
MSYSVYRQRPGWGTNQFSFDTPPAPSFQPQPSWGGWDFYRAHAGSSPDPSLFNSAWNRVRDYNYSNYRDYPGGVGIHEARHWHSRAFGGLGELNHMLPAEIGHAAAYEAYRKWIHHSSMYEPLSADIERQREALIGLAVAETTMLLQYTTRGIDLYTRGAAAEAAAATASHIFFWSRDHDDYDPEFRGRSSGSYSGSSYGDLYAYDRDAMYSRHRRRSRSPYHYPLDDGSSSIPMMHNSSYGSSYDNSYGSYGGIPAHPASMPMRGRSMSIVGPTPYASGMPYPGVRYPYAAAPPQTQYVHAGGMVMPSTQLQQEMPMVLYQPKRYHHHHHHHRSSKHKKRSRSVSVEPLYISY